MYHLNNLFFIIIDDWYSEYINKKLYINNNPLAPQHPYRILVVGPSGQGKINKRLGKKFFRRLFVRKITTS